MSRNFVLTTIPVYLSISKPFRYRHDSRDAKLFRKSGRNRSYGGVLEDGVCHLN